MINSANLVLLSIHFFSLCSFPLLLNFMAMPSPYRFFRCSLRLVPLAELEEVVW